jgi:hypothetical protein
MVAAVAACLLASHGEAQAPPQPPPQPQPAAKAPGVLKLGALAQKFGPVTFDHPKHVKAGKGDCAACHHQHPAGALKSCTGCHTMTPEAFRSSITTNSFNECRSCHGVAAPDRPGVVPLQVAYHRQCFQCHRQAVHGDPEGCTSMCHDTPAAKKAH